MKKKKNHTKRLPKLNWSLLRVWLLTLPSLGLLLVTLIGFFGDIHWLLDIFSNFRLQYTWIAVVLLIYCGLLKFWAHFKGRVAIGAVTLALLINGWLVGSLYFPLNTATNDTDFTVLFSNIFIYNNQSARLLKFIDLEDPDVVALAEVNDRMFGYYQMKLQGEYPFSYHKRHKRSFGVAIFSKTQPKNEDIVQWYSEDALPSLKLNLEFENKPVDVIVTHPYPPMSNWFYNQRNNQLLGLADAVEESTTSTVVVGDFNMTPWSPIFKKILDKSHLQSTMQGKGVQTSWPTWVPSPMRIPIDHSLYKGDLEVVRRERGPMMGSDHRPIVVEFAVK